mgnify:CR=1 FL=1
MIGTFDAAVPLTHSLDRYQTMEYQSSYSMNGDLLLELYGEMDAPGCTQLRPLLEKLVSAKESYNVLLDLSEVNFIDSSGIGAIVFLFKRLKAQGQSLVIRGVHGQPRELMELLHVGSAIPVSVGTDANYGSGDVQCSV